MDVTGLTAITPHPLPATPAQPLAGGTWLMSEPRAAAPTWVDLGGRDWDDVVIDDTHVSLGAMVSLTDLPRHLERWSGAHALAQAALAATAASTKVLSQATLGGNLCLGLPFGIINPLLQLWQGSAEIIAPAKPSRQIAIADLQRGAQETTLASAELLRRVVIPRAALTGAGTIQHLRLNAASPPTLSVWLWCPPDAPAHVVVSAGVPHPAHTTATSSKAAADALTNLDFLDDNLGPASYRRRILPVLIRRAWEQLHP
jgi:CO/xanthine dehydrogenase FAD-binding subunit